MIEKGSRFVGGETVHDDCGGLRVFAFQKIDKSGIMIKGDVVKINSGGSPGSGTEPKAPTPEQPPVPTLPKDADHRGEY